MCSGTERDSEKMTIQKHPLAYSVAQDDAQNERKGIKRDMWMNTATIEALHDRPQTEHREKQFNKLTGENVRG